MSVTNLGATMPDRRGLHAFGLVLIGLIVGAVAVWIVSLPLPAPETSPPSDAGVMRADAFVFAMRQWSAEQDYWTEFDDRTDRALLGLGVQVCAELDDGRDRSEVETRMSGILGSEGAESTQQADLLIYYATTYLCPDHAESGEEEVEFGPI